MFQGATELTLDAKGRLAVPTRHRDALLAADRAVILTWHPDGCVLLYPRPAWEPIREKIQALSSMSQQSRAWQRLLVGHAEVVEPDAQGRVLIPPVLRKRAELAKDVMLVGQGSHFELWNLTSWEQALARALEQASTPLPPGAENFSL